MNKNYRKTALEKLQSPEQLDKMIQITSPMFWIAALGGGLVSEGDTIKRDQVIATLALPQISAFG